jgi:quercetin dioxygenase-like cupin family protein
MAKRKNEKYIVSELKGFPETSSGAAAVYSEWAKRVLFLSDKVVPGAYNMMFSWYLKPPPEPLEAHTHDNPEIIIFLGSNPEDPYDLGGEIEFWLEDEEYNLTKSCFIWVPRNMKHCPMVIKRVDRPIIHLGSSVKPGYKV